MESWQLNYTAAFDYLKGIATRIGKSYEWCRRQCHAPADYPDYYGAFLVWWYAVLSVNPTGADHYINDLIARRDAARCPGELAEAEWSEAVAAAAEEVGQGIAVATRRRDAALIAKEVSEGIEKLQRVLALNRAHAHAQNYQEHR
jgi:hypothetical protein